MTKKKHIVAFCILNFIVTLAIFAGILFYIHRNVYDQRCFDRSLAGCDKLTIEYWQPAAKPAWKPMKVITGLNEVQQVANILVIQDKAQSPCACVDTCHFIFSSPYKEVILYIPHPLQGPHININGREYLLTKEAAKELKDFFESNSLPDPELLMNANP